MSSKLDHAGFEKLRRIVPSLLVSHRAEADAKASPVPDEIAFKLTNRCDLRCAHCYQWNEQGYHRHLDQVDRHGDLDLAVVAKVLAATRGRKSNVFLWGGEPLIYHDWDGLVALLVADPRWTSICTNGTMIDRRLESLCRISEQLEMVIALDGFEDAHDQLRGAGSFRRTAEGLASLRREKQEGRFRGEITCNVVIGDAMVGRLFDFLADLEERGVEAVYLSFPWFLSDETSAMMDRHVADHFAWLLPVAPPSWHSYKFRLDVGALEQLTAELARIDAASWRMKVRYNPALRPEEMREFLLGSHKPAQNKTRCLALRTRMDVFPNADVVSCKFFPEFAVGNLARQSVSEVWHGSRFDRVRQTVAHCGLMPVCAKCNLLYTRGA